MKIQSIKKMRILVVEDDPALLEANVRHIEEWFPEVEISTANCGQKAQEKIIENPSFDLIISDAQMPNGTGVELLQFCEQSKFKMPVIMYHGGRVSSEEIMSASKNCFAIVIKPGIEELKEKVEKAISAIAC